MIVFDAATHVYSDDGKVIPSVTQILVDSKICDYSMMDAKWREFAMKRGSFVHKGTELYDKGTLDLLKLDPILAPYIRAYIQFRTDLQWQIIQSESLVYNKKEKYAGTLDRVFQLMDQRRILIDIKSSEAPPDWLILQLAAYAKAMPVLPDGVAGLCLKKDGTYKLTPVYWRGDINKAFVTFKAAIVVAKFNGRKKVS